MIRGHFRRPLCGSDHGFERLRSFQNVRSAKDFVELVESRLSPCAGVCCQAERPDVIAKQEFDGGVAPPAGVPVEGEDDCLAIRTEASRKMFDEVHAGQVQDISLHAAVLAGLPVIAMPSCSVVEGQSSDHHPADDWPPGDPPVFSCPLKVYKIVVPVAGLMA